MLILFANAADGSKESKVQNVSSCMCGWFGQKADIENNDESDPQHVS
jgi:hypothetical protein